MFVFNLPKRTCLLSQAKKPPTSVGGSYVGITYLPGQANVLSCRRDTNMRLKVDLDFRE